MRKNCLCGLSYTPARNGDKSSKAQKSRDGFLLIVGEEQKLIKRIETPAHRQNCVNLSDLKRTRVDQMKRPQFTVGSLINRIV